MPVYSRHEVQVRAYGPRSSSSPHFTVKVSGAHLTDCIAPASISTRHLESAISLELIEMSDLKPQMCRLNGPTWLSPDIPDSHVVGYIENVTMAVRSMGITNEWTGSFYVYNSFRRDVHVIVGREWAAHLRMQIRCVVPGGRLKLLLY